MPLTPLAARYDQFILDLDGCVWVGGEPTPGVVEALDGAARGGQALRLRDQQRLRVRRGPGRAALEDRRAGLAAATWSRSAARCSTVLADTRTGRTAFVIGTRADAPARRATPGLKVLNGTDLASRAEVVVIGRHHRPRLRRPAQRRPGGPARRRPARHRARPHLPPAGRPLAGHGRDRRRRGVRDRAHGRDRRQARAQLFLTALDRLGDGSTLVVGDRVGSDLAAAAAAGPGRRARAQ